MTKDALRKCSHCGHNGHNTRTCKGCTSIKLFGVKINVSDENHYGHHDSIRRSKSMGSLQQALKSLDHNAVGARESGYLSDGVDRSNRCRKKGSSWSEEEHRLFLIGLEKLGKGDWRGISRTYVPSRTPTQVASHAQKYFIRMSCMDKKKKRTSVFDIALHELNQQNAPPQGIPSPSSLEPLPDIQNQAGSVSLLSNKDESKEKKVIETANERRQISPVGKPFSIVQNSMHERPPISPPLVVPSFNPMPFVNLSASAGVMPAVTWVPVPTYPNHQNYGYIASFQGRYASCMQYMTTGPQSSVLMSPPVPSPAGGPPPATASNKEGLHLPLGALSL
ncbi:unnamed protein product [Cuscuta epithymum]|uniref:Uncharacterized protein n=1 Tax=Cuscuta epithymum TaxID=186058 RepID=A0AAV0D7L0_9ASTE|nr:unnamed protein product [Cuscuta epithymum]